MDIDWVALKKEENPIERSKMIQGWINRCTPNDPIFLSDCILRGSSIGLYVLEELAAAENRAIQTRGEPMLWNIFVICDKWGKEPLPGETVFKINKKSLKHANGDIIPPGERNLAIIDGSYEELFEDHRPYVVDDKGCIQCSFTDAGHFLNLWGVHAKTNRAMVPHKKKSPEPVDHPDGGQQFEYNWLYKEMTKDMYEALPKRKAKPKKREKKEEPTSGFADAPNL
ncbi:MAG: hypothetical protein GY835_19665 [bacterium]|nr:hypothetical protein [bacterium]